MKVKKRTFKKNLEPKKRVNKFLNQLKKKPLKKYKKRKTKSSAKISLKEKLFGLKNSPGLSLQKVFL